MNRLKLMKYGLLTAFCLIFALSFSQNQTLFEQGNQLYNQGEFDAAIKKYEKIVDSGEHSAELYYNLGNAHYKLNHIAPSIFYYEKALQLAPNDKEIKNNMAFAKNMTIDSVENIPELGLSRIFKNIINTFSANTWAILSVSFMVLFVILFLVYYLTFSTLKKRSSFTTSMVSLGICIITLSFAFLKFDIDKNDKPAIVFAQESQVKSEPNLRSSEVFMLHEGTKVQILDTVNNWKKIKLSDGKTGWMLEGDLRLL